MKRSRLFVWGGGLCVVVAVAVISLIVSFPPYRSSYSIVLLGDSIIGNSREGETIAGQLERLLEVPVLKGGFGGSRAAFREEENRPGVLKEWLSLVKLVDAIAVRDFSVQRSLAAFGDRYWMTYPQTFDYYTDCIRELARTDFQKVDYVVIEHGTNDYNGGIPLDNRQDPYDESTFGGALRTSIESLKGGFPNLQIILMTPTWCAFYGEERSTCEERDFGGGLLEDYVGLELQIGQDYGLLVLDNYHDSGIWEETEEKYLYDGLHLTVAGQQLIAERIADAIREIEAR